LAWSLAGIQAAFYMYAVAALLAAVVAASTVERRRSFTSPRAGEVPRSGGGAAQL
jgi:hypothetical protein